MLAGEVPFKSTSILGLYKEICEAPLEFMDDVFISDSLKHLLRRLLDKNPDSRMTLTAVMTHPWVTYNGELPLLPVSMVSLCRPKIFHSHELNHSAQTLSISSRH